MKTTKSIYLAVLLLFASATTFAQIGVDNTSPDPSSVLDLAASDKGVLIPRMTTVQRLAIPSPGASLLVFDTTEGKFYFYTGMQWATLNSFDQNSGSTTAVHNGNVVINGTLTASSFGGINVSGVVPPGGIIMWSGTVANIPTGWALCNGTNGTPNLTDRFIIGAGATYAPGANAGSNTVAISTANIPQLTHSVTVGQSGSHSHNYNDDFMFENYTTTVNNGFHPDTNMQGLGGNYRGQATTDVNNMNAFYRLKTTTPVSDHAHTVTVANHGTLNPTPLNIMPRYYALAYIMKL